MAFRGEINREGRKKGSLNKNTKAVRDAFQLLVEDNLPKLQKDLDSLKPIQRLGVIIKLAEFVLPKLRSVAVQNENNMESLMVKLIQTPPIDYDRL